MVGMTIGLGGTPSFTQADGAEKVIGTNIDRGALPFLRSATESTDNWDLLIHFSCPAFSCVCPVMRKSLCMSQIMRKTLTVVGLLLFFIGAYMLTMGILYKYRVFELTDVSNIRRDLDRERRELRAEDRERILDFYARGMADECFRECLAWCALFFTGGLASFAASRLIGRTPPRHGYSDE
jgi:hypothetical protein